MKKTRLVLARIIVLVTLAFVLNGCVAAIGNREPARSNATLGQQLIDLQKAKDSGVITEAEYTTQRAKFLAEK
jgi:PBP1b-binding outer membrane lipoprotein LpoB